jgi:UDP-N-acetylglucosamine acyltransferase
MGKRIHPSAVIDPSAELADDIEVGPGVVIEADCRLGPGSVLMAHSYVGRGTIMGEGNVLHIGAVVGHAPQDISTTGQEDARARVGDRNTFREYCTVHRGSRDGSETVIGNDCFIMAQAHIAHDCILGDRIIMAVGALLAGHVEMEDSAFISGNAAVHQFCRIGEYAFVSGLSRVSKDPPPYFLIKGDSQVFGLNSVGLKRAGFSEEERLLIRRAYKILFRKSRSLESALREIENTLSHSPHAMHLVDFVRKSERGICTHARKGTPRR